MYCIDLETILFKLATTINGIGCLLSPTIDWKWATTSARSNHMLHHSSNSSSSSSGGNQFTNVKLIVGSLILFVILLMTVWRKGKKAKKANRIYQSGGFLFSCAPLKILEARVHCKLDNQNEIAFTETKWNAGLLRFTFLSYIKSPFIHNPRQTTDKHNTYDHR